MRIGIDIGNVIIGGGGVDTFFTEDFLETPEVLGALWSLNDLRKLGHELHVISKCGPNTELKSMLWLEHHGFMTILVRHRIHFVRKRPLKAPMAQALELGVFIDDRQDIIDTMQGVVENPILFTSWANTFDHLEEIPSFRS